MDGYGRGWREPKAVGLWARFKQKAREPATKTDAIIWLVFVPIIGFLASFIVSFLVIRLP